jgi:hypothetical protein
MDKMIAQHLNRMVGGAKSVIGYIHSQLDVFYGKIHSRRQSSLKKIVPIISRRHRVNHNDLFPSVRQAEILYFRKPKR